MYISCMLAQHLILKAFEAHATPQYCAPDAACCHSLLQLTSYASASPVVIAACIYQGMDAVLAILLDARYAWHSCPAHDAD